MTTCIDTPLTANERSELDQLEASIEKGLAAFDRVNQVLDQVLDADWSVFLRVGADLMKIRDKRLYRPETWEKYCLRRWTYTGSLISRRIRRFEVLRDIATRLCQFGTTGRGASPIPNEAQTRELYKVPPAQRAEVMGVADDLAASSGQRRTAETIRTAAQFTHPKEPSVKPQPQTAKPKPTPLPKPSAEVLEAHGIEQIRRIMVRLVSECRQKLRGEMRRRVERGCRIITEAIEAD